MNPKKTKTEPERTRRDVLKVAAAGGAGLYVGCVPQAPIVAQQQKGRGADATLVTQTAQLSKVWGPLTSKLTQAAKNAVEAIAKSAPEEAWFRRMVRDKARAKQLYTCPKHGFFLFGHVEAKGTNWPPHNHGSGWVVYAVAQGESQMGLFGTVTTSRGELLVVQKDRFTLRPGDVRVFLPGDIHETLALQPDTVLLRLTSCDLSEEKATGRLVRYGAFTRWSS